MIDPVAMVQVALLRRKQAGGMTILMQQPQQHQDLRQNALRVQVPEIWDHASLNEVMVE